MHLKMFCLCLDNNLLEPVKKLNYFPVGLSKDSFTNEWWRDNTGENISLKNQYYGEYSFHFWFWKNYLNKLKDNKDWIGFCAYRRFWSKKEFRIDKKILNLEEEVIDHVPEKWKNYEVILGNHMDVSDFKLSKLLKYGKMAFLKNPKIIFRNKRNIKFQFDMFHGTGFIDKAINLLDDANRDDFRNYVNSKSSYNQGNMFITNSIEIMSNYYQTVFNWLFECEKIFGLELHGYGKQRMYAFLAERFLPYWFNKNCKVLEWPIIFYDLKKDLSKS